MEMKKRTKKNYTFCFVSSNHRWSTFDLMNEYCILSPGLEMSRNKQPKI